MRRRFSSRAPLYGLTEATSVATWFRVRRLATSPRRRTPMFRSSLVSAVPLQKSSARSFSSSTSTERATWRSRAAM